MFRVVEERHGRYIEIWETLGHWAERADGTSFWYIESYIRCLKVKPA